MQEEQNNEIKESILIQRLVSLLVQGRLTLHIFHSHTVSDPGCASSICLEIAMGSVI